MHTIPPQKKRGGKYGSYFLWSRRHPSVGPYHHPLRISGRCSNPLDQGVSRDFLAFYETAPFLSAQANAQAAKLYGMI